MAKTQEDVIEQVRKLWRLADHPNTPPAEKELAASRARDLMAKYMIEEIMLSEGDGKTRKQDVVVGRIRITTDGKDPSIKDQRIALAWVIGRHNRCRGVVTPMQESVNVDTGRVIPGGTFLTVVGFKHDVDFIREFYFGLAMDLLTALMDEPSKKPNYQAEFAAGYVTTIERRLEDIGRVVESAVGMALVLRDQSTAVNDFFDTMFPPDSLDKQRVSRRTYDPNARERGRRAAERADIGQERMGTGTKGALGEGSG